MPLTPPPDILSRTPIYRMVHGACLSALLTRQRMHAPSCVPRDGLKYVGIHAKETQRERGSKPVPIDPGGVIKDYVGFYFGPRSPMLYRIHTGHKVDRVPQERILYLVSSAQSVAKAGLDFVFTDRHSLTSVVKFQNTLENLGIVDFHVAYSEQWNTTPEHPDRQEKKQAEFLVYQSMPWKLIDKIGVANDVVKSRVEQILSAHPDVHHPIVITNPSWYY